MASDKARTLFRKEMSSRMRRLRKGVSLSQSGMAALLGVTTEAYKKQEQRGSLQSDKVPVFALATKSTVSYVLTGREPSTSEDLPAPASRRRA